MSLLRRMILDVGPHGQEKLSYKIPFFYFKGPLCYLNPTFDGLDIGFVRGKELSNEQGLLELKGRKFVKTIRLHSLAELSEKEHAIRQILNEAAILNEHYRLQKKK